MKPKNKKNYAYYERKLNHLLVELNTVYDAESQKAIKRKISKLQKFMNEHFKMENKKLTEGEW